MTNKRILIFNVNWLGDVLFSTATIRNLRYNFPRGYIACVIPSRCYLVLKDNPYLDEIIIFDEDDRHKGLLAKLNFIRLLKRKKFDQVFLLHRSFTRAVICFLAGIPERIGYYTKKRSFLLTLKIIPPNRDALHRIDYYLNVIEQAGFKAEDRYTDFMIKENDIIYVRDFLKKKGVEDDDFLVVLNPGGNWLPKRWPKEYWLALIDRLACEYPCKIVVTGAIPDINLINEVMGRRRENVISSCGALNLKQLGALLKRADLFISADSGPLHIANAVGAKKIIALFGPTDPLVTAPYPDKNLLILRGNIDCQIPCYKQDCADNRCMKAVSVEDVLEKVKRA
ncbi:MAG: lipopolysaccharide heptosyltransferase II [Candidatus Omnitrophica bacterium]|nr:lipopolysaccharide heptosyltransferase II [Candidatus Omnitrophota bacterium]